MIFKRLVAMMLSAILIVMMLPVSGLALDFFFNDNKVEGDMIKLKHSINNKMSSSLPLNYTTKPKDIIIAPVDGVYFRVNLGSDNARITPHKQDFSEWTVEDMKTVETTVRIVLEDGSVVDRYHLSFNLHDGVVAHLGATDKNGMSVNQDSLVKDEIYTLTLSLMDKNNTHELSEWADSTWEIQDEAPIGITELGTAVGTAPSFTNTLKLSDYGSVRVYAQVNNANGGFNGVSAKFSIDNSVGENSGFYYTSSDVYGVENYRLYPNEVRSDIFSVGVPTGVWRSGNRFYSTKKPVSVTSSNPSIYSFRLENVVNDGGKYRGGVAFKLNDNDPAKAEWTAEDVGKSYQCKATITFDDGSSVQYTYNTRIVPRPFPRVFEDEGQVIESGKTHTQLMEVWDKANMLSDDTDVIVNWQVVTGKSNVALGVSGVRIPATKNIIPIENTLTFNGRGTVIINVEFSNNPVIIQENSGGRVTDVEKNLSETVRMTYKVTGKAEPMSAGDVAKLSAVEDNKLTVTVPSNNTLGTGALNAIATEAEKSNLSSISLKVNDKVSMGIGISSLNLDDPANFAFKQSIEDNGGVFDPLVTLSAPSSAMDKGIQTDGGYWIDFSHNGALPSDTVITADLQDMLENYDDLVVWYYNSKSGLMERQDDIAVDIDGGKCSFALDHCSAWAIYPNIEGFDPNPTGTTNDKPSRGSSSGSTYKTYPTVEAGIASLANVKSLQETLPNNVVVSKSATGTPIAVIQVAGTNIGLGDMNLLGKLSSNVGLKFAAKAGLAGSSMEVIIPGGFGSVAELGRIGYSLDYADKAENSDVMLRAVKGAGATSNTAKIGGNHTLPVAATITVSTKATDGSIVYIYKYDPHTQKLITIGKATAKGGKLIFATKIMGEMLFTTGTI